MPDRSTGDHLRCPLAKTIVAPGHARRFVADAVAYRFAAERAFELALVVGELANNAVMYGEEPIDLVITEGEHHVRIEMCDASPAMPTVVEANEHGGRGMRLVDLLADRWGAVANAGAGKHVWVEFDAFASTAEP